jgi:hypothetical protein
LTSIVQIPWRKKVDIAKLTSDRFDTEAEALKHHYARRVIVRVFSRPNVTARTYEEIMAATTPRGRYTDVVFELTHVDGQYMYVCKGES